MEVKENNILFTDIPGEWDYALILKKKFQNFNFGKKRLRGGKNPPP